MAAEDRFGHMTGFCQTRRMKGQRHIYMSLFSSLIKWEDMKATDHVEINILYLIHSLYVERAKPRVSSVNN